MDSRLDSALKTPICDLSTDIYQQLPSISKSSPLLAFFRIKVRLIKAHCLFSPALLNPFLFIKVLPFPPVTEMQLSTNAIVLWNFSVLLLLFSF